MPPSDRHNEQTEEPIIPFNYLPCLFSNSQYEKDSFFNALIFHCKLHRCSSENWEQSNSDKY